jgi:hypothetical protein
MCRHGRRVEEAVAASVDWRKIKNLDSPAMIRARAGER